MSAKTIQLGRTEPSVLRLQLVELEQDSLNDGIRISFDTVLGAEKYIVYSSTPTQSLYLLEMRNKIRLV